MEPGSESELDELNHFHLSGLIYSFVTLRNKMIRKSFIILLLACSSFLQSQNLYFPPTTGDTWETQDPLTLNWCAEKIDSLYAYLDSNHTKAFVLLKGGKIVLEKYFGNHTQNTPWQWASAGKTLTSFMTGIAQQEGLLSINDTSSKYLGKGWTACTAEQEDKITIRHQLTMTSGLDDGVPENYCTLDTCLLYKSDAGTRWAYHNAPYTLLDSVIEQATGQTLNAYVAQKLKTPTGMTGFFIKLGYNNVFFSNARSMARFGLLMLNKGKWNSTPVLTDSTYYRQLINTSQNLNLSYGFLWWLNGKNSFRLPTSQLVFPGPLIPSAPDDLYMALGKDGQFLNVAPSEDMVWVRMGESPDGLLVPYLLNEGVWQRINELICFINSLPASEKDDSLLQLFPNPASETLSIRSQKALKTISLYNLQGQLLNSLKTEGNTATVQTSQIGSGLYFISVTFADNTVQARKFAVE